VVGQDDRVTDGVTLGMYSTSRLCIAMGKLVFCTEARHERRRRTAFLSERRGRRHVTHPLFRAARHGIRVRFRPLQQDYSKYGFMTLQ
jgi:hypothetical protein